MSDSLKRPYTRRPTHPVRIGRTLIGADNPVAVQTMTNTSTLDADATARQIASCAKAGAPIVRVTAQGVAHAAAIGEIRRLLDEAGVAVDIVADIHFNPDAAFEAALHADKVRINPGNFVSTGRALPETDYTDEQYIAERKRLEDKFIPFLELCRRHGRAIRIGVNHGSLSNRIMSRYGDTPQGMVESAMELLRVATRLSFNDVVVSIKSSNVLVMTATVRLLAEAMSKENMSFPLHLGVTEAGDGEDGRVKSAVGIGSLLADGIGDTIRVSLSEAPEAEIPVADAILRHVALLADGHSFVFEDAHDETVPRDIITPYVVGLDTDSRYGTVLHARYPADWTEEKVTVAASIDMGRLLLTHKKVDGIEITAAGVSRDRLNSLALTILQATRRRISKTEYIACPGCGRTMFDLAGTLARVRTATSHLKGLKIGVMGCIVNGPGEMADADYGYVGGARGRVSIYRGKECVERNLTPDEAITALIRLIKEDGRWVEPAATEK